MPLCLRGKLRPSRSSNPEGKRQPTVIFAVLSRSTQSYDRGETWRGYQTIPSLTHCIFIAQDEPRVEVYAREGRSWRYEVLDRADDALVLPALAVRIPLTEIYETTGVAPVLAAMVRDA